MWLRHESAVNSERYDTTSVKRELLTLTDCGCCAQAVRGGEAAGSRQRDRRDRLGHGTGAHSINVSCSTLNSHHFTDFNSRIQTLEQVQILYIASLDYSQECRVYDLFTCTRCFFIGS